MSRLVDTLLDRIERAAVDRSQALVERERFATLFRSANDDLHTLKRLVGLIVEADTTDNAPALERAIHAAREFIQHDAAQNKDIPF